MAKYIDAEKLVAEIERLKSNMDDRDPLAPNQKAGYLFGLADVLSFLSTLESEKPINQDGLKEEIESYWKENGPMSHAEYDRLTNIACHFAQWGAEHLKK